MSRILLVLFFCTGWVSSSVAEVNLPPEQIEGLRLQIFLDREACGPGVLDGKPGWVTQQALGMYFRKAPQFAEDPVAFDGHLRAQVQEVTATAIIPRSAEEFVDPKLSRDREEQAKGEGMPYRSLLEYVAERYHTTEDLLVQLNGKKAISAMQPGSSVIVPKIDPFLIEAVKDIKAPEDEVLSGRQVFIDTSHKRLTIYNYYPEQENEWEVVASFPITPGKEEFLHYGVWKLVNCVPLPTWRFDKQLLETGERGEKALHIPGGPNSPVGVIWAGLNKSGIGIHGTAEPRTIGRSRSAGCIRLANWDVVRLPDFVRPGATVTLR